MLSGKNIERREAKSRVFRLEHPLFIQIPKTLAAAALAACALSAIIASHASPIHFGPFFLLICAFGAWFVGNRFAVLLGLFIASVQVLNGHSILLQDGGVVMALQFCSALAVVLMLGVARAALEIEWRYARVDPLTGALNRKAFFEAVKSESGKTGVTVLFFADADGLKRLNDQFGHEAGDEALRALADRMRNAIRRDDIIARIGGDEFAILLRVRDTWAAYLVAQRLNAILNREIFESEAQLNCSLGALILPAGSRSIDAELKQADTLMYRAKRDGHGLVIAISTNGGKQGSIPFTPIENLDGQLRASVRSADRATESTLGVEGATKSLAA